MRGPRTIAVAALTATALSAACLGSVAGAVAGPIPAGAVSEVTDEPSSPPPSPTPEPTPTPAPSEEEKVRFVSKTTRIVLGRSVQGRKIVAYRKGDLKAKHRVVLLGQMHGNERAGVTTAKAAKKLKVRSDTVVWIIPTMNPDGHAANTRTNARGVDLNRKWPMNWRRSARGLTYSGPRAKSEPETRAMMKFLKRAKPTYVVSLHQPFAKVGLMKEKPRGFQRRLAKGLDLPLGTIGIGGPAPPPMDPEEEKAKGFQPGTGGNLPTLTGWYNARYPGTAVTVEFARHPRKKFVKRRAPRAILKAARAR